MDVVMTWIQVMSVGMDEDGLMNIAGGRAAEGGDSNISGKLGSQRNK